MPESTESTSKGISKLYTYELRGKRGTVVFPDVISWKEAKRRLVVKFGNEVKLVGLDIV